MYELKLRSILRQLKSKNPQKRYNALGQLYQYKQKEGYQLQIDILKDMMKTAASRFPEPVDSWDNPSYFLIDFVCDFARAEVVEGLMKYFDGFDLQAKERAIDFLLWTEQEETFYFLEEKIIHLIQTEDFIIPMKELSSYPVLIKGILDETLDKLDSKNYKFSMYDLLLSLNASGLEQGYRKDEIIPQLLKDYQTEKLEYLKFDRDFSSKFVYNAWKDSYFIVRNRIRLLIDLMEYYYTPEIGNELEEALKFQDPFLKMEALLVSIVKKLPYQEETLLHCAEHIETAEMVYWELKNNNLEQLYPFPEGKQQHLAKTRLFSTIINLPEENENRTHYPEDIQIVDKLEMDNYYGQPTRYYLMRFNEYDRTYAAWVGGYALEDGDDTASILDGSFTDYVEFDSATIEEHKRTFLQNQEKDWQTYENSIYFASSPRLSTGTWFFLALVFTHWIREVMNGFVDGSLPILFILTSAGAGIFGYQFVKNKKRNILIYARKLVKKDGSHHNSIALADIKKVEYDNKHVLIYDKKNELVFKFPLNWVPYELFYAQMKERTNHLKNKPFIQS